ncbi:MAG TPA: hypothetical protein VJS90_18410 [Pseudomonas sp.]|uniref:hypothetical protein n=1 Tax=Pseudomonas sp. TaxID=306 RepID=UPI002B4983A6|nr:hypothetical protein [Pseudomonas sp.]HKS15008.1 hypothetical protein [Pseudomonas sp.]
MTTDKDWRKKAHTILDEGLARRSTFRMTQDSFSKELGISRQTLWRDKSVMEKFERYRLASRAKPHKKDKDSRIAELEYIVTQLKNENGVLLLNFVLACTKLRENNHDPRLFFSEVAIDIQKYFPSLTPAQLYERFKQDPS